MNTFDYLYLTSIKQRERFRSVLSLTPNISGKRCLDIGCGNGLFLHMLKKAGAHAIGIDRFFAAAKAARSAGLTVVADAAHLPFKQHSFQTLFALESIYYIDETLLSGESHRVLEPAGLFCLTAPYAYPSVNLWKLYGTLSVPNISGHTAVYKDNDIITRFPNFSVKKDDSFSILFIELIQILARKVLGKSLTQEPTSPVIHTKLTAKSLLALILIPIVRVCSMLDSILKKLGMTGHNKTYLLQAKI